MNSWGLTRALRSTLSNWLRESVGAVIACFIAACLVLVPAASAVQAAPGAPDAEAAPASFLIGVEPGDSVADAAAAAAAQGLTVVRSWPELGLMQVQAPMMASTGDSAEAAAAQLRALSGLPNLRFAEPDYQVYAADAFQAAGPVDMAGDPLEAPPNDPLLANQWAVERTNLLQGWQTSIGASSVTIAVIDSGMATQHEDLAGANRWVNPAEANGLPNLDDDGNGFVDDIHGWDWVDRDNDADDPMGHGTHVSGAIAAVADNGKGGVGFGRNLSVMPLRILDALGSGYVSDLIDAMSYARASGARIVNLSLVLPFNSAALGDAVSGLRRAGILVVAAAGNTGSSVLWPARYEDAVAVAATDRNDLRASFSSFGPEIDIAAPGVGILSTYRDNGYRSLNGTSMATPHVSALAGLIWSLRPDYGPDDVVSLLRASAADVNAASAPGPDPFLGAGRIDFNAALWKASETLRLDPIAAPAAVVKPSDDLHYQIQVLTPAAGAASPLRVQGAVVGFQMWHTGVNASQASAERLAVTDRDGVATVQLTAPADAGPYVTRVRTGGRTLDLPLEVASGPGSISITIDRDRFEAGEPDLSNSATYRIEVRNENGELRSSPYDLHLFTEVGMFGDANLSQELNLIASGGVHEGTFFPGTIADKGRLIARVEEIAADTELVVEPGPPMALYVPPVWEQQHFDNNGEIRLALEAVLRDQYGNLVRDGTPVKFAATNDKVTITPASVATVDGNATTEFVLTEVTYDPISVWVQSPGSAAFNWIEIPVLMPRLFLPMFHAP